MYLNYPLPSNTPYMYMYRLPKLATRAETVFRNGIIKSRKKIAMPDCFEGSKRSFQRDVQIRKRNLKKELAHTSDESTTYITASISQLRLVHFYFTSRKMPGKTISRLSSLFQIISRNEKHVSCP